MGRKAVVGAKHEVGRRQVADLVTARCRLVSQDRRRIARVLALQVVDEEGDQHWIKLLTAHG